VNPDLPILVFSSYDERVFGSRMIRAGARGFLMKHASAQDVLAAMRRLLDGGVYASAALSSQLLGEFVGSKAETGNHRIGILTDRELEVVRLWGEGRDSRQIARALGISLKTVDVHCANIRRKLNLPHTSALVHFAARWVVARAASDLAHPFEREVLRAGRGQAS
jgi:DNA-binding NarL/FixJ family response regulator